MDERNQIEEMANCLCREYGTDRCNPDCGAHGHCNIYFDCKVLYNAGYRKQSEGEWISVDERLPDRAGKYLVATSDGRVGIGNLIDYYCDGDLSFDNYKVTHWMTLPQPPKMKGE